MSGALVLVVGPSGAGKDTLIARARDALEGEPRFLFARRAVTRSAGDANEDHLPIGPADFDAAEAAGAYCLSWRAHGLAYGVPDAVRDAVAAGRIVIVNGSRGVVAEALARFPRVGVIEVTASPETLAARLAARGRESAEAIALRVARPEPPAPAGVDRRVVVNDGSVAQALADFVAALRAIAAASSPRHSAAASATASPAAGPMREAMTETILTNARLVTEDGVVDGTLVFTPAGIVAVDAGRSGLPSAIDCDGDLVIPGIVEMHTDNLEKHLLPRPRVRWPSPIAAAIANDAQMAASGITTVYDAVCAGTYENAVSERKDIFYEEIEAVEAGVRFGLFRIEHRLHLRCELSDPELPRLVEPHVGKPILALVSLMDHTPGQRQWRNLAHLRTYMQGTGRSDAEIDAAIAARRKRGADAVSNNWPVIVDMFRNSGIVLASHDDTTEEHVADAVVSGCAISEFPTTLVAARAARAAGLKTIMGGPNVVRGGSHSGGVAARELAEAGLLDGLSSDYVPASLLQAVHHLTLDPGLSWHEAFGLVTWRVADMVGLSDRGRLKPGLRADVVRLRYHGGVPVVGRVWASGRIAF